MKSDITNVIPGFTDPKQQPAILKRLAEYSKSVGFTSDEIKNIRDRRLLLLTYKAMMFDNIVEDHAKNKGNK